MPWITPRAFSANTCGETIEIWDACARKLAVLFSLEVEYQSDSSFCAPARVLVAEIRTIERVPASERNLAGMVGRF